MDTRGSPQTAWKQSSQTRKQPAVLRNYVRCSGVPGGGEMAGGSGLVSPKTAGTVNQAGSNKEDSVVHFCVRHWCRDTMHKAELQRATAVEVVCQQTSGAKISWHANAVSWAMRCLLSPKCPSFHFSNCGPWQVCSGMLGFFLKNLLDAQHFLHFALNILHNSI